MMEKSEKSGPPEAKISYQEVSSISNIFVWHRFFLSIY